ncbi:hypothetical protein J6TS2_34310 [Heyndrickxia sporothermodurans]|nr:hypothetical protein J6TS2_34310 [Heyndrickxia sporothermodurans]
MNNNETLLFNCVKHHLFEKILVGINIDGLTRRQVTLNVFPDNIKISFFFERKNAWWGKIIIRQ